MKKEIQKKIQMVNELSDTITKYVRGIEKISYHVFVDNVKKFNADEPCYKNEFVKVTFPGGGYNAKDCSGDSCQAIVEEVARMLDGDYFDDVTRFDKYASSPDFEDISEKLLLKK